MASPAAQGGGHWPVTWPRATSLSEIASSLSEQAYYLQRRDDATPQDASAKKGIGIISFLTAFVAALIIFTVQISVFVLLRNKLARILYDITPRLLTMNC